MRDPQIIDTIEAAKEQQRAMLPTGALDDKAQQFLTHNRNPGSPCNCLDCRAVREMFSREETD